MVMSLWQTYLIPHWSHYGLVTKTHTSLVTLWSCHYGKHTLYLIGRTTVSSLRNIPLWSHYGHVTMTHIPHWSHYGHVTKTHTSLGALWYVTIANIPHWSHYGHVTYLQNTTTVFSKLIIYYYFIRKYFPKLHN